MKVTNNPNELLISIPKGLIDMEDIQDFIDFLQYKILVSKSEASKEDIEKLTEEISHSLKEANKSFLNLGS